MSVGTVIRICIVHTTNEVMIAIAIISLLYQMVLFGDLLKSMVE